MDCFLTGKQEWFLEIIPTHNLNTVQIMTDKYTTNVAEQW